MLESHGVPTVVFVTEPFERVARASAAARGAAKLPIVVLPAGFDDLATEAAAAVVRDRLADVVDALVR